MISIDELTDRAAKYLKDLNKNQFIKAYEFAKEAHNGQIRKSGDEYITHPLETASILTELHADESTLIAALLHDVPEDTSCSLKDIEKHFGKDVAFLVSGITKLSKVYYRHHMEERQIDSLKKLLLHSAKDARVILIKLADRLHNMRTLNSLTNNAKQLRIAKETLEIYAPIANLFGIEVIKSEMEDLCFKYLSKMKFDALNEQLKEKQAEFGMMLQKTIEKTSKALKEHHIVHKIQGRVKNMYSIFKKMETTNKSFDQIEDIIAVRIILKRVEECYKVMGIIHQLFKPKLRGVKDYIAVPKVNGYKSLHTIVFGVEGILIEFQIRTEEMHLEALYGLAGYYFYDQEIEQSKKKQLAAMREDTWARKILLLQREMKDNRHFLENLRCDIFEDRIFAFTPKGDVTDLPKGATCLDFAYAIHTDLGHSASYGMINDRKVTLSSPINTGDTIRIVTNKRQICPKREWLSFVRTQLARNKIKDKLKKETKEQRMQMGRLFLERELKKTSKNFYEIFNYRNINFLLKELSFKVFPDLLVAVGEGTLDPKMILDKLYSSRFHSYEEIIGSAILKNKQGPYKVKLKIVGHDRVGFLKSVLTPIEALNVNILKTTTIADLKSNKAITFLTLVIKDFDELSRLYEVLREVEGVELVERVMPKRTLWLFSLAIIAFLFWSILPFGIHKVLTRSEPHWLFFWLVSISGHFIIFFSIFYLYQMLRGYFADVSHKTFTTWVIPLLAFVASLTILVEMMLFRIPFSIAIVYSSINFVICTIGVSLIARKMGFYHKMFEAK